MRIQKTMASMLSISPNINVVPGGLGGAPPSPWEDVKGGPAGSGPPFFSFRSDLPFDLS